MPVAADELSNTEPPAQKVVGPPGVIVGVAGIGFTVIVMVFDVAGLPVAQVALEVSCTLIASPFTKVDDTYVTPVSPLIGVTPLYHWYVGAPPPLVGVAVKVTLVPAQIVLPGAAAIVTLTGKFGFTVTTVAADGSDGQPFSVTTTVYEPLVVAV